MPQTSFEPCGSFFELDPDLAGPDGSLQGRMVALGLVGVSHGEVAHRFVEIAARAQVAAILVIGVPFRGSYLVLAAAAALFMLAALGLGFVVSSATRNRVSAGRLTLTAGYLPTIMLSGLLFDLRNAPAPIQWISHLVAARYFVSTLHTLFLVGNVWPVILPNMAGMALIALVLLAVAMHLNRKRLG